MHNKGTFVCCFHLAYKYIVWTWKCIFVYQLRRLIIYSPDPGKPRKHSEEAFITLINQDIQKAILIQLSVDVTESGFSFSLQVF